MKKFLGLTILFIMFFSFANISAMANVNEAEFVKHGDELLLKAENNETPELTNMYLNKAIYYYYAASKNNPPSIEALVGLGRIYMLKNNYREAKNAFFKAYSIDNYNPDTNFYYAEFLFKYDEFEKALKYYKNAQKLGYKDQNKNNEMILKCYAKLGDEENLPETNENK